MLLPCAPGKLIKTATRALGGRSLLHWPWNWIGRMADLGRAQQTLRLPSSDLPLADWIKMCVVEAKRPPCFTKNPADFSRFFHTLKALEAKQILGTEPLINLTDQLDRLLRVDKFNQIMDEDLFFYAVLFYHVISWREAYTITCRNKLIEKVIERLKNFPTLKLVNMLKNSILSVVRSVQWQWKEVNIGAFPGICEQWLGICKNETLSRERYIYVAFACVTMGIKIALCQGKVRKTSSKWWTNLLVEPSKHIDMKEEALKDLSEGLKFMIECEVPPEHMVTLEHLQAMVSGKVRSLAVARDFLETITSYCQLEHWGRDSFLTRFLRPLRKTYKDRHFRTLWTNYTSGIADLTMREGASVKNIIDEGLQFILTVCHLVDKIKSYGGSMGDYDEECGKWIKLLLDLVVYNDATALQCIKLFTDPQSEVFQYFGTNIIIPRLNIDFQNYLKQYIVDVSWFMEIFDSASDIWQRQVLELFIANKLPDNARLSDIGWKRYIQQFEKSYEGEALRQQQLLLPLLNSFAAQYQSNKRSFDMIVHLLQLDTPCLFMKMPSAGSDPSQHEPQQFKKFLKQFIHSNNLRKSFFDEYEVLLENTSPTANQFQVVIVTVMLEEILSVKQHCRVNMTSKIASSALYVLTEADSNRCLDMKSARVRLASGLLYHLSSYIHPSITDLKWLSDDVCRLAQIYKLVTKINSFKFVVSVEDKSRLLQFGTSYPRDVLRFFEFILEVKKALRTWNGRLLRKQVTFQDIVDLSSLVQNIADLADYLALTDISISDDKLASIKDQYQSVAADLECVLVSRIPDLSDLEWCCLSKLLEKHEVGFDDVIRDKIYKLVDMSAVCQQRTSIIKPVALVCDVQSLLQSIEKFLEPLQPCLDVLIFFELQQSNLFKRYLKSSLRGSQELSPLPVTKEHLNKASNVTVDLIWKLCDGSATVQEVTLCDSLQLEDIDIKKERSILSHFARIFSNRVSPKRSSSCEGLKGVTAVLDLLKNYEDVFTIREVCKQFKLTKCHEDPDLVCLVEVAEELQSKERRAQLTMDEAVRKMALFNEKLLLKDKHSRTIFQLFKEVKECKAVFEFAEEKGFAGEAGRKKFVTNHKIVTTQLQHEDYNAVVLNHLLGCFDYINPFLSRPSSFSELMQLVTSLPNIENGIRQLRTVNLNIGLIKMWFEGEGYENTARQLKTIIKSRVIFLRAVGSSDPVKLTLECDPDSKTIAATSDQPWSCEKLKEFAAQVNFMKYELPAKRQEDHKVDSNDIDVFLHVFNKAQQLKSLLQDLRILQIRNEIILNQISLSWADISIIDSLVEKARKDLNTWLKSTQEHRDRDCQWLVFFSNRKLLQLHHFLVKEPLEHAEYIVREISVIFPNDLPTRASQAKFVKKAIGDLDGKLQSLPPIKSAVVFLNKLMEYNVLHAPQQVMLVRQSTCSGKDVTAHGPVRLRHFTLHYIPGFTHKQQMQLLFDILQGIPLPFQLLRCTAITNTEELELFFQRMAKFPEHQYVVFNTNVLSSDIQEVLVRRCLDLLDSTAAAGSDTVTLPMLHFTETGHSVLRQMPWIIVNEHKDHESLPTTEHVRQWFKSSRDRVNFKTIELVYGNAGDGKTHYIRKELAKGWHGHTMALSINECFDPVEVIKLLRGMPLEQRYFALFLNFTLPKPVEARAVSSKQQQDANQAENKQFWRLASEIHWFFFYLLVIGYVEDHSSGLSFRLPGGLQWSVFIEVPAWCGDDAKQSLTQFNNDNAKQSLTQFNNDFPTFHYIGREVHISHAIPFDTDGDIDMQLVCKYLRAKEAGLLDQWRYRGNRNPMPYKIGRIIKDLKSDECQKILENCLPSSQPKVIQRLYLKYIERRCKILEACPALMYNEGVGERIEVWDKERKQVKFTNVKHVRSLLFKTMEREVKNFCDQSLDSEQNHQQLIYDSDAASFMFLSLKPDKISSEERKQFKESGIKITPLMDCHNRDFLDSCLSHALKIPLNSNGRISLIDENQYVMTLDYLVKMLNIHERRKCGIPVIINGETGVGKTFLLEMLSILWNQSLLSALDQLRSSLMDILISKLQYMSDIGVDGMESLILNSLEDWFRYVNCPLDKTVTPADMAVVNSVLTALKAPDSTSGKSVSYDSLLHVLNLPDPHEPLSSLYRLFCSRLLNRLYDPLFSLVVFPEDMPGGSDMQSHFEQASSDDAHVATTRLLYGLFAGQPKKTFHKLCVHAALTVDNIKKFFEAVISEAKAILRWYSYGASQRSSVGQYGTAAAPPSLTIFLDEVNTASCPGFIKEIITDRTIDGKEIPENIFIVAACNPHRANSLAGQAEWFVGSYYVRPFHRTLQMLMWNYGSLSVAREKEYIDSKMSMTEPNIEPGKRTFLANLISKSQELVRGYAAEHLQDNHPAEVVEVMSKSTVSQRDIQRVFTLYKWLQKYFTSLGKYQLEEEDETAHIWSIKLRALFVALAVVYYFRLNSTCREKFAEVMQQYHTLYGKGKVSVWFMTALTDELDWTINNMTLPPGIAKTEALKENVFATVVCTMTQLPLIIVGQPGSSKTLSFKIVTMNLLGQGSPNAVFRNCEVFKTLDPHFYQCSRKSTSVEIETVFQQAIKRQASLNELSNDKLSVVMMDEAGLPERSHESLKVLHYYLDDQKVAFVGISNHILDAAKMNRAVSLFRPDLCQEDVEVLAKGCLLTYSEPMRDRDANYVRGFSHSYLDIMRDARIHVNTFFGLRDFIHFCAYLRRSQETLTPQLVISALERNFNGSKHFGLISRYFLERVFKIGRSTDKVKQQGVLEVLKMSLADHPKDLSAENEVRYKLIIDSSEDGSLVRLLFSFGVLKREVTRVHMSSDFPADSDSDKLGVVAAIKHSASQGHAVVLSQTDTVHECFYDLFNQRFVCIDDSTHGKRFYANVAIGSYIKPCPVHPHFQCVVIIKDSDLPHTPAAFLNRFEKYSLSHQLLLSDLLKYLPPILRGLVNTIRDKVSQFLSCCGESCLYGQNPVTLDSLLLTILPFHLPATHADSQSCSRRVKTKHAKLLAYLEWAMQHHLGFRFSLSSAAELLADGAHIEQMILDNKTTHAGQLKDLTEADIPEVVDEAMTFLKQDGAELDMTANTELVIVLVKQWLITYLCKRLLQLMTPEALVTNHKKLPNHYISHYLNQQSHFSLKGVIVSYHSNLVQEWHTNVKSGTSLVPNKLLCYCRSSDRLHNMPHEANTAAGLFLQEFIFPDTEKLQIVKITSLTTQEKLSLQIKGFNKKIYEEVLVLVANVEDVSLNTINHIRIMIEEFEVTQMVSVPKLFVLLLHFPPRLFFNHFYSSYYLHGWDHYYLDTVGAGSTSTSINIQKWFSQCCAEPDNMVAPGSFMEDAYLNSLLSEALPLVASHISLKGCSDSELAASRSLGSKIDHLNELLFKRGLDKVVFAHFTSYWTPSVMIDISEQAANLARLLESTLSITDAVNTIVKSNFYDFLLYILSLLNDCQSIMIVINSYVKSPVEELALSVMSNYPIPRNLSELKMQSIRIGKLSATKDGTQPKFSFPFFCFVYELIEEQLNQCRRELAKQIAFVSNEEQGSIDSLDVLGTTQATLNEIHRTMVDCLVSLFSSKDEPSAEGSRRQERQCLDAVFAAMDSREVWNRYVKDFCATKLSLGSELFAKSMENTLTASTESSILCRVADLHVRVRLYHLDSESLSLMRVLDELQKRYQAIPEEQCNVDLFERPQKLFAVVIEATYSVLLIIAESTQTCVNELKRLSSTYLQLMRLPTIGGDATIRTSTAVKTRWDILHTAMLMLNTEEELDEKFARQVLEFFLYLHMKYCDKTSPVPAPCLSSLMDYTYKHLFVCPDESKQQLLEGILEHFFPPNGAYDEQDVTWFLQQLIASVTVFSRQPATIRCLKLYLTRILTTTNCPSVESSDSINPLHLYDDKTREGVATVLLESPTHDAPFVPDFYQQCDAVLVPDNPECLLADLYFSISLEFMRQKRLDIPYLIDLINNISQILANESTSPLNSIILAVENQVLIHILLETLACKLSLDNDEIFRLLDFVDDINKILNDHETGGGSDGGSRGLMLTIHMLRRHRSVHMIHRHLVTCYDDLCRKYSCLDSLHSKIQQQIDKAAGSRRKSLLNDQFPFKLINNRQCREGVVYLKIRTELNIINTIAERRRKDSITKFMETVTSCYTVGLRGDSQKYMFNMAILLCVYYEYYCKKKCSQVLASVLETELKHFLDKGFLNLLVGLVDHNRLQYHPEQTAVTGSQDAVDPLYSFFTQSFKDTSVEDPDSLAMQHTLVHLVAAIVGSPIEYTNLWYHMFSPEQLKGSHIPGFNSAAACGAGQDEVLYDMATKLSNDGFNLEHKQLLHTTRGQLNIYSRYFTLWANYSALCLSLFMDSTLADQLIEAGMFFPGLPLRHYCFTRATDAWQLLCRNMNITVEERVQLVNQTIEHYYMESRVNTECLKGPYDTRERVDECETFLHEKCFAPAWCSVQQKHTEVYSALSTYYSKDLRVLDSYYPECATKETFLLQLLSSTRLHDPTGPLYVLYQFVLKRPLFNAGGKLLPDLVDFYLWLHEEMAYRVLPDYAQQLSIRVSLSTVLNTYSPTMRDQRHRQFNHVKKLYNSYEGRVGGRLEDSTKLIELLSVADEKLNRGNILYNTIISIVDNFNQFLTAAVGHYSLRRMWRYFSNYYNAIPLVEMTVDTCCFGVCLSLEDFSDLMPLISKCCNLKRLTTSSTPCCDPSLFSGCVPQVYDLLQLQEDIARQFLAGKQLLQKPSMIHCDFHFRKFTPMTSVSDAFFQCSVTRSLETLHSKFKDDLEPEDMKKVKYECHSLSYYTLLEVIIGLTSALNQLQKVLHEYRDQEWTPLLDKTLAEFINSRTGSRSPKEVLKVIGISRFNNQADVSLRDSQYDCLKSLKMRHVFKTLELLTDWMREGMFDFCVLPFSLKTDMRVEDRDHLRSVEKETEGKAVSVLGEIKYITEWLIQCEGDFTATGSVISEVKPILDVLRETCELNDKQMESVVMRHISSEVQVQHYVHLRLELRRLHEVIRNTVAKEDSSEGDATWSDWIMGEDTDTIRETATHGFDKWYENTTETDLARRAAVAAQSPEEEEREDKPNKQPAEEWTPPASIVKEATRRRSTAVAGDIIPCSLPASKSPEDCQELADLGSQYVDIVEFLNSIGLTQAADIVANDGFTGDIITDDDEVLKDIEMDAIGRLRFRVLFQRELLKQTTPVAVAFPVERVVAFFEKKHVLAKCAAAIEEKDIDGEMLLLADGEALKQLGVSAAGVKLIKGQFKNLVLETLGNQSS